jgi:hypothetical protein
MKEHGLTRCHDNVERRVKLTPEEAKLAISHHGARRQRNLLSFKSRWKISQHVWYAIKPPERTHCLSNHTTPHRLVGRGAASDSEENSHVIESSPSGEG